MKNTNLMFKFSLDPLEFRNSGIRGIAGIGTWMRNFLPQKRRVIHDFHTYRPDEKHESDVKI